MSTQPNYLTQALAMGARGVHVVFIEPHTKACRQSGWENLATTSPEQIVAMAEAKPAWTNFACVGKAIEGGIFIFDDDSGGAIRTEYESVGTKLLPTLKVRTWSGKFHYYFRHSAKSLAYQKATGKSYISEKKVGEKGELWSLRMHNSYGVGPAPLSRKTDRRANTRLPMTPRLLRYQIPFWIFSSADTRQHNRERFNRQLLWR